MKPAHFWIGFSLGMGEWCLLDCIAGEQVLMNGAFVAFHALVVFWWFLRLVDEAREEGERLK